MDCSEMTAAGSLMHNQIASALIASIAAALLGSRKPGHDVQTVQTHIAHRIYAIWPDCPLDIAAFVPYGIIIVDPPSGCKASAWIIIVEFARCYSIEKEDLTENAAVKHNQYRATTAPSSS
eukprot:1679885-Rhodomonas_salina.3